MIGQFPELNQNKTENFEEKMTASFSEDKAEIQIQNLSLQKEGDHSKEFVIKFEKEPTRLEEGKQYAQYCIFDKETEKMKSIVDEVKQFQNLPEEERLPKILKILRQYVKYPFKKEGDDLKLKDSELAAWVETNLLTDAIKIMNLSDTFEKGYGICGNLSLAYLYLAEKAGLQGTIMSSEVIKNINRSDNNEQLFKLVDVGKRAPSHFWCEIKLSSGKWIPVDPSTNLIGDEKGIEDFKKANYIGRPASLPCNIDINPGLKCPINIDFLPGDGHGQAICEVTNPVKLISFSPLKKEFIPYKGDCKLNISIDHEKETDMLIKIKDICEYDKFEKS